MGPESFVMFLKDEEARNTLYKFGTDFNIMALCLTFRNDRLVLRNPSSIFLNNRANSQSTPLRTDEDNPTQNLKYGSSFNKPIQNTVQG